MNMKKILALILMLMLGASALAEVLPYSTVYEPETSFVLATTVAWEADGLPEGEKLPATALVYLDDQLSVYTAEGALIDASLSSYIEKTSGQVIPALYIRDEATAAALKDWLEQSGLGDVFVVADWQNAPLVHEVAQLAYVRGMVDFRSLESADDLTEIIKTTNGNFAKVALLPEHLATAENVRFLQGRLLTVWAECEGSMKSLLTQYTNGTNGVLVKDPSQAIAALEFFSDDAPTLLRVPFIIGHRGMPSVYVENTILSALGAYTAGADSVETDIRLSADGELFINHDSNMERLFARADIDDVEALTLAELQQIPYDNDAPTGVQARNHTSADEAVGGKVVYLPSLRLPSYAELCDTFAGSGVVIDTEIKSQNPQIVSVLKAMVEENESFGDMFVITFNTAILDEMVETWPEMSVGALGTQGAGRSADQPNFSDYERIIRRKGVEKALEMLYGEIDPWNATWNPKYDFSYEVAVAGRHRGLTVWPWTYTEPEIFAEAYLSGLYGLTTNFAWWASDFVVDIQAEDAEVKEGGALEPPTVTTQRGECTSAEDAELIVVEGSLDQPGEALCIYRLKQQLTIEGQSYGDYYLYSNPFTVTVRSAEAA